MMKSIIILCGLLILSSCSSRVELPKADMTPIVLTNINQSKLLSLINNARSTARECGSNHYDVAEPLEWNELLERVAYNHSKDMNTNGFFAHIGSDGKLPSERLNDTNYTWQRSSENIALGYANENSVVKGWLISPAHCANIMDAYATQIGIAKDGEYWTAVFTN